MKYLSFEYFKSLPDRLKVKNELDPNDDRYFTDVSGFQINRSTSTQYETTVFSCVRVISESIAQLPCVLLNDQNGEKKKAVGNPLYNVLLRRPNPFMSAFDFWKFSIVSMCYKGFALHKVIRSDFRNTVIGLIPMHPEGVTVTIADDGELVFNGILVTDIANKSMKKTTIKGKDAFYTPYMTIDGFTPIGPIAWNMLTVGLSDEMRKNTKNFVNNNSTPPGILKHPSTLDEGAQKRLRESWQYANTGNNKGKVAILEQGMEFKAIGMSNQEAQFLELRQFEKQEICGIFGVPVDLISDTKQSKGWSTVEQQYQAFISGALNPYMTRFEQSITTDLIPQNQWENQYANFNTKYLLKGDLKSRSEFYKNMLPLGVLNANEVRGMEDMSPRDGGNEYYRLNNYEIDAEDTTEEIPDE